MDENTTFMPHCNPFIGLCTPALQGVSQLHMILLKAVFCFWISDLAERSLKTHVAWQLPIGYTAEEGQEHKPFQKKPAVT